MSFCWLWGVVLTTRKSFTRELILEAFRRTHASNRTTQTVEQPAQSSNCPRYFPIGYHVTIALSHPTHAGKGMTVCRRTKKYVMFTPNKHSSDIIPYSPNH